MSHMHAQTTIISRCLHIHFQSGYSPGGAHKATCCTRLQIPTSFSPDVDMEYTDTSNIQHKVADSTTLSADLDMDFTYK